MKRGLAECGEPGAMLARPLRRMPSGKAEMVPDESEHDAGVLRHEAPALLDTSLPGEVGFPKCKLHFGELERT